MSVSPANKEQTLWRLYNCVPSHENNPDAICCGGPIGYVQITWDEEIRYYEVSNEKNKQ